MLATGVVFVIFMMAVVGWVWRCDALEEGVRRADLQVAQEPVDRTRGQPAELQRRAENLGADGAVSIDTGESTLSAPMDGQERPGRVGEMQVRLLFIY